MTTTKWVIDPIHSEIQFKVKHLMISTVTGVFTRYESIIETEGESLVTAKGSFSADVNSITTFNDQRDGHLRTADFFDEANHHKVSFLVERVEKVSDENYAIYGTFSMRGVSKRISLNAEFGGLTKDQWGNTKIGLSLTGKINRKDFGVNFGLLDDATSAIVSNEVKLIANVQFIKQAEV